MLRLTESPTRQEALRFISDSASYGNLGAFIGAGFSKAVLNDEINEIALSWGELLEKASGKLGVDYGAISKTGVGYPEIATSICKLHAEHNRCDYTHSLSILKREIAALTSWYPDKEKREEFSKYLEILSPSWIITTNYDMVIESLLTGRSIPLGPNDSLSSPTGVIPVFHLHGLRTNPEEIIISQEDYVSLFRPSEYRQIKLALTIRESTTLLVGYGLGDVNVLTAIDWSKNVFKGGGATYPNDVIQVLRKDNPKEKPYRDKNGIIILETEEISEFFEEFIDVREVDLKEKDKERKDLEELAKKLDEPDGVMIEKFIDDEKFREEILTVLSKFNIHLISGFVSFLNKCIDETWTRSAPNGAFEGYNQNLKLILDILTSFPISRFPPALFQTAAYGLQRVGYYVGDEGGKSWSAKRTWEKRKKELSKEVVAELRSIADQHGYNYVERLAKTIDV
ncbi:SIR2 family NAD-dependent protein deacylase [Hylemonella sp. W303a]|uniref:SIR2 family NAD-dependent protein deacylase n=1 Tax=Hylemonella sp. W303a TaxID=3389873 RepID=UPI00396B1372